MSNPYAHALEFLVDAGVTLAVMDKPNNRFEIPSLIDESVIEEPKKPKKPSAVHPQNIREVQAHKDILAKAEQIAKTARSVGELKQAILDFDDMPLKKDATNIVFADGNPDSDIMIIGDFPRGDDDRSGIPFSGAIGILFDNILKSIALSRKPSDTQTGVYVTNLLNWRPPGNRTPTAEEIEISLPFLKRHIELIKPKHILVFGGAAMQALLDKDTTISRLRGSFHDYNNAKMIATYHPDALTKTPLHKRKVWHDMLMLQEALNDA